MPPILDPRTIENLGPARRCRRHRAGHPDGECWARGGRRALGPLRAPASRRCAGGGGTGEQWRRWMGAGARAASSRCAGLGHAEPTCVRAVRADGAAGPGRRGERGEFRWSLAHGSTRGGCVARHRRVRRSPPRHGIAGGTDSRPRNPSAGNRRPDRSGSLDRCRARSHSCRSHRDLWRASPRTRARP